MYATCECSLCIYMRPCHLDFITSPGRLPHQRRIGQLYPACAQTDGVEDDDGGGREGMPGAGFGGSGHNQHHRLGKSKRHSIISGRPTLTHPRQGLTTDRLKPPLTLSVSFVSATSRGCGGLVPSLCICRSLSPSSLTDSSACVLVGVWWLAGLRDTAPK